MSEVKDWMPKRPEMNGYMFNEEYLVALEEHIDRIESLFKDAKICYGQLPGAGRTCHLGFVRINSDTHEFLVIGRPIEKPKPKTDRELLEAIVRAHYNLAHGHCESDSEGLSDLIQQAREALEKRGENK